MPTTCHASQGQRRHAFAVHASFVHCFFNNILGQVAAALYDAVASELAPYAIVLPQGVQRPAWVQRSVCFSGSNGWKEQKMSKVVGIGW